MKSVKTNKDGYIQKKAFKDFMAVVGLGGNKALIDKIFHVFDIN